MASLDGCFVKEVKEAVKLVDIPAHTSNSGTAKSHDFLSESSLKGYLDGEGKEAPSLRFMFVTLKHTCTCLTEVAQYANAIHGGRCRSPSPCSNSFVEAMT